MLRIKKINSAIMLFCAEFSRLLVPSDLARFVKAAAFYSIIISFAHNVSTAAEDRFAIIRDSEIEGVIQDISKDLIKTSGLKNLKIYLVDTDDLNAFATSRETIFLFKRMITDFADIDILRGVIAHEIGHIQGGHIVRSTEAIDRYNKFALSSAAIGIAASLITTSSEQGAIASLAASMHFAERSVLAHSRAFESSADQYAMKILSQNDYSVVGMIKMFDKTKNTGSISDYSSLNEYDQTHPLNDNRVKAMKNFYANSKQKHSKTDAIMDARFARAAAKLWAFTVAKAKIRKLLHEAPYASKPALNNYFNSILYFRIGDYAKAINYVDKLIAISPNDPFYLELKGEILFAFGKNEALNYYDKALSIRKDDMLLLFSRAIVGLEIYKNYTCAFKASKPAEHNICNLQQKYLNDLLVISNIDEDNLLALRYISVYYDRVGLKNESMLYSAILASKTGDIKRAKYLAKLVIKSLPKNSVNWYKANDIIMIDEK